MSDNIIKKVEAAQLKDIPDFGPGDTVKVYVRIREGEKERTQIFQGIVLSRKGRSLTETFTVRKVSGGIGVERVFPIHSPNIAQIDIVKRGKVRRAKLYYLRKKRGKAAKIREKRVVK